jgi:hypothetical protein
MASVILYRADKRDFNQGQEIQSAKQFHEQNPRGSDKVESIFEAKRPDTKPSRLDALYLFEDFVVAKKHWSKMTDGKLYEVRVEASEVRHRGDMRLVDEAFCCSDLFNPLPFLRSYQRIRLNADTICLTGRPPNKAPNPTSDCKRNSGFYVIALSGALLYQHSMTGIALKAEFSRSTKKVGKGRISASGS